MAGLVCRSFDSPEETRPFPEGTGQLDLVNVNSGPVGRAVFQPGWQWSQARQADCSNRQLPGRAHGLLRGGTDEGRMDDGEEAEFGPGDFMICPPGHDAWIVGEEPCVMIDWQGHG